MMIWHTCSWMQKTLTERSPYPFGEHVHHPRALFHDTMVTKIYRTGDRTNSSRYPRYRSQVSYSKRHTRLHSATWYLHLSCCSSPEEQLPLVMYWVYCTLVLGVFEVLLFSLMEATCYVLSSWCPKPWSTVHGGHLLCIVFLVSYLEVLSLFYMGAICFALGILYVGSQCPIPWGRPFALH